MGTTKLTFSMWERIKTYLSFVRFAHTVFAMPFALVGWAYGTINIGYIDIKTLGWIILAMVFARNTAMGFNRLVDRKWDALNERTKQRELPSGKISFQQALWFVIINAALFVTVTYFINKVCFYLSPVALAIIMGYSYTKRFTSLSHLILGLALALAPIGAYLAVTATWENNLLFIGLAVLTWVAGFDIIYALQDVEFDRRFGLYSIPARWGKEKALHFSAFLHLWTIVFLTLFGLFTQRNWLYWGGVGVFGALLFYQHWIVRPNDLSKVNQAFFVSNGRASLLFAALAIMDFYIEL